MGQPDPPKYAPRWGPEGAGAVCLLGEIYRRSPTYDAPVTQGLVGLWVPGPWDENLWK